MLSRFGQACLQQGWTLRDFEFSYDDDDPFDHPVLVLKDDAYVDPDIMDSVAFSGLVDDDGEYVGGVKGTGGVKGVPISFYESGVTH